jgi:hypothetical protein
LVDARRHPIQAVDIRVDRIVAQRRSRLPDETAVTPDTYLPRVELLRRGDDGFSFTISVETRVVVPLVDDMVWAASLRILTEFVSDVEVSEQEAELFARLSGLFLVWPYARTHMTELARMAGVPAPVLPLLSRPEAVDARPPGSEPGPMEQ